MSIDPVEFEKQTSGIKFRKATLITIFLVAIPSLILFLKFGISPTVDQLEQAGSGSGIALKEGQWWRLISPVFLHADVFHLIGNLIALYIVGKYVEYLYSVANFFFLFLFAGISGALASAVINPQVVSVGASGAIFGLYGAVIAALLLKEKNLIKAFPKGSLLYLALQAFSSISRGFQNTGVDNSAHVGGLVAGISLGYFLLKAESNSTQTENGSAFSVGNFNRKQVLTTSFALYAISAFILTFSIPKQNNEVKEIKTLLENVSNISKLWKEWEQNIDSYDGQKTTFEEYKKWSVDFNPRWEKCISDFNNQNPTEERMKNLILKWKTYVSNLDKTYQTLKKDVQEGDRQPSSVLAEDRHAEILKSAEESGAIASNMTFELMKEHHMLSQEQIDNIKSKSEGE